MNTKTTLVDKDTFKVITKATNKAVDFVRPTYGPAGYKVIIDKLTHKTVLDDGVQVMRDLEFEDPAENAVLRRIREVSGKTSDRVGDGTTGALIVLQGIINEVAKKSRFNSRNVEIELRKGFEEFKLKITKQAKQIKTREDLKKVALVSFDNEEIAEMISGLYHKLGKDATITVDNSGSLDTYAEISEGINIPSGYISPYMVNNQERMECVVDKPYILITDYRLTEATDITPIMDKLLTEKLVGAGKSGLVIIAENVEQHALATMVINLSHVMNPQTQKLGPMMSVAVVAPKDDRAVTLEDIAIQTGARVFSTDKGSKLENVNIADLGRADKFVAKREESFIIGPKGKKGNVENAVKALEANIKNEKDEKKQKVFEGRLAKFTNKIATIKVGAPTDIEQKALKKKIENSVNSTKTAFNSGVVAGGGISLARIKTTSPILNEALKLPHRQLMENMGLEDAVVGGTDAFNVVTEEYGNFMEIGVMDPLDVLVAGAESAVSIACVLITSCGIIVETQEKE